MLSRPFVVLDLETTGLSASKHAITEVAALKFVNGSLVDEFHSLVNPGVPIPSFIQKLTGISDDLLVDAPSFDSLIPSLKEFIADHPLIAHNASFDISFLNKHFSLDNPVICTLKLSRRLLDVPSCRLGFLCDHFGINLVGAHRASNDARVTADLFLKLYSLLSEKGFSSLDDILLLQSVPVNKAKRLLG